MATLKMTVFPPTDGGMAESSNVGVQATTQLGAALNGGVDYTPGVAGSPGGLGCDEREAYAASTWEGAPHRCDNGGPPLHGELGDEGGPNDDALRQVSVGAVGGDRCSDSAPRRLERHPILCGSAGNAWTTPRFVQDVGASNSRRTGVSWLSNVVRGEELPSPRVSVRFGVRCFSIGEVRDTSAQLTPASTAVPRNRKGRKGADAVKAENDMLRAEIAIIKPQILKRECDYESQQSMMYIHSQLKQLNEIGIGGG